MPDPDLPVRLATCGSRSPCAPAGEGLSLKAASLQLCRPVARQRFAVMASLGALELKRPPLVGRLGSTVRY
jgi:hypothetical protein